MSEETAGDSTIVVFPYSSGNKILTLNLSLFQYYVKPTQVFSGLALPSK